MTQQNPFEAGYAIEVEPFDPENPKGSLGLRRRRLKLAQIQLDALRRLIARSRIDECEEGIFRSLIYGLECEIENESRDLRYDELDELDRLNRLAGLAK